MQPIGMTRMSRVARNVLVIVAIALGIAMVFVTASLAAPKAQDAEECSVVSHMGLLAAALAKSDVPRAVAVRVMAEIYNAAESERIRAMIAAVIVVAFRDKPAPGHFSETLFAACVRGRGDMDGVLGVDS